MTDFPALPCPPCPPIPLDKTKVDVAHIFLVYTSHLGDAVAVADECKVPVEIVRQLASEESWDKKLRHLLDLSKSGNPGDWERAHNRATNLVQCVRLRRIVDRMLGEFEKMKDEMLFVGSESETVATNGSTKVTKSYSAKIPADLAATLEKVQHLTYMALSDSLGERKEMAVSNPAKSEQNAVNMHKALVALLNKSEVRPSSVGLLTESQAALTPVGEQVIAQAHAAHEAGHFEREGDKAGEMDGAMKAMIKAGG